MHGSFSRADTHNFMAAYGPDFKHGLIDRAPVSNADIGVTIARIMHLTPASHGSLLGRVLTESMPGGSLPPTTHGERRSPAANGVATVVLWQQVGRTRYLDAAGFPGKTVGL